MHSLNRATPPSARARLWGLGRRPRPLLLLLGRPSVASAAGGGDGGDGGGDGNEASPPAPPRRLSPGDRRRAQRAAVAARRAERRRSLLAGRGGRDDDEDDDEAIVATPAAAAAPSSRPPRRPKPRTSAEARARLAEHVDPAALAALDQLEGAVGRLPPLQAAALLSMAQGEMKARFDAAFASVEADGGGQLAALFAAAAADRAEKGQGNFSEGSSSSYDSIERVKHSLMADEALDRAIWEMCVSRALTPPQRAVLEKIVVGVPLRRAPDALARALAGGLDPANIPEGVDENDDEAALNVHAFAVSRRLELLTEAEGVHLQRAVASLASTLASLREAAFAVEGAEEARREFERSLAGMVAEAEEQEEEEDDGSGAAADDADAAATTTHEAAAEQQEPEEEDLDPLQRRLKAYSKYARVLAEGSPNEARALWYSAGGEPSDAFRALKDVVRRIVEVSLVVPQLAKHEEGRAEAAARAWQEAYDRFKEEEQGGGGGEEEQDGAAEDAADRAARLAADAYDAANPEGAELSRNAEKLRAARRTLQRRVVDDDDEEEDDDAAGNDAEDDDDDEDEASARAYRQLLAPLTDEEAAAAFVSLSDELGAILAAIQEEAGGSPPEGDEKEGRGNTNRPTAAGRWAPSRRAAGADARSAALYLAALTDDDGAFDASPANLARLCTFLRAAEALEALKALATHSQEVRAPDLSYGTDRATARSRRASRAVRDSFAERESHAFSAASKGPGSTPRGASLKPPTGPEAVRLAGLDRDDWWVPQEKRGKAWSAVRVAELDASFAGKVAAAGSKRGKKNKGKGGGGRGFENLGGAEGGADGTSGGEGGGGGGGAAEAPFAAENPYRALLRFADEGRIRELAALDADDLLFLADMERCGWGDDDCLVKWTLHPRVGARLRATAAPGGGGYGGGAGGAAFFEGLPESLRELMREARAAAAAERREEGDKQGV
jgi:hypothetical protein